MIIAIEENLKKGIKLLQSITDDAYSNTSVAPYHASIGCHIRHILDVFSCILNGLETKNIDLTTRERNEKIELKTKLGIEYFESVIHQLKNITKNYNLSETLLVTDDLGLGKVTTTYTLGGILMQAQSHTIHHFASIGYIIHQIGVELPDKNFGLNPTTPKTVAVSIN